MASRLIQRVRSFAATSLARPSPRSQYMTCRSSSRAASCLSGESVASGCDMTNLLAGQALDDLLHAARRDRDGMRHRIAQWCAKIVAPDSLTADDPDALRQNV